VKKRGLIPLVVLLLLALVVTACGAPAATATPTPTVPPPTATTPPGTSAPKPTYPPVAIGDWVVYDMPKDSFALSLPPEWMLIDMNPNNVQASLDAVTAKDADLGQVVTGQVGSMLQAGVSFFGFDPTEEAVTEQVPTEATVQRQTITQLLTLDDIRTLSLNQLQQSTSIEQPVNERRVNVQAGEAEEMSFNVNLTDDSGQTVTLSVVQYLLVRKYDLWVVTLTTTISQADKYEPIFQQIGQSFNFIPTERTEVDITGAPVMGSADAPVTIVEFSEFQCPYCGNYARETFPQIEQQYIETGKVKYVFRNFPLSFHENAEKAAEAGVCAADQGKFWEYHETLFNNQDALAVDNLKQYAADLGLDTAKFDQCLDSGAMADKVQSDIDAGTGYGVSGTPAFFVNGIFVSGAMPLEVFQSIIDDELAQ
jgi:predicted DsbA family dithiol-disulfide isomerase